MEEKDVDRRDKWEWALYSAGRNHRGYFMEERGADTQYPDGRLIRLSCQKHVEGWVIAKNPTIKNLHFDWSRASELYYTPSQGGIQMVDAAMAIVYTPRDPSEYPVPGGDIKRNYQGTLFLWKTAWVESQKQKETLEVYDRGAVT